VREQDADMANAHSFFELWGVNTINTRCDRRCDYRCNRCGNCLQRSSIVYPGRAVVANFNYLQT